MPKKKIISGSMGEAMTSVEFIPGVDEEQRKAAKKNILAHEPGAIDILEMLDLDMV